ncbi:MAG: hypothetical protein BMS9Abin28_0043 [Anaerolineae bacterium]|nr:MAG: hypothetical protein BMS9Abin28_0043 [Anaerolineae bacterium]
MSGVQKRLGIVVTTLVVVGLACNLPSTSPTEVSAGQAETAIAGTVRARIAETAFPAEPTEADTPVPVATDVQPQSPTAPAPQATTTLAYTATPSVPMVSVSLNTNCRTGPGRSYDYRGALLVGETEEVVALSTVPNYWYITNPDQPGKFCYLWGEYATVVGNTEALPEFTPLPSPTATATPTPSNTPTSTFTPSPTP